MRNAQPAKCICIGWIVGHFLRLWRNKPRTFEQRTRKPRNADDLTAQGSVAAGGSFPGIRALLQGDELCGGHEGDVLGTAASTCSNALPNFR